MSRVDALLDTTGLARLREALTSAEYTSQGIKDHLGAAATAALARNDFRAALKITEEQCDRLATLIRLFVCGQTEPLSRVAAALAPLPLEAALPLLEADGDGVRAAVELEPYGDWWVVADLSASMRPGRPLPGDHVLGIGGASTTLAAATLRHPVGSALDLGTGCGVQALHLSAHARRVTATDVLPRALRFAATTAALNGLDWELLRGDLTGPVRGRRFDLVVSNPPFVAGPGTTAHTYRDSGRPGDAVCAELVAAAPGLLADGGHMQFLANWLHVAGESWQDRVAGWLAGTGLDAWVVQREVSDPVAYVNLWLTDASEDPRVQPALAASWLDWFDARKVDAVGFGLVTLRAGGHEDPTVRIEDLRQTVDGPLGPLIGDWFDRQDFLRDGDLLATRFRAAPGLRLQQEASQGPEGWEVDRQLLMLPDGLRWIEEVDPVALALVGACDGSVTLRDQVDVLAAAHAVPAEVLADVAVPLVAHLVERGILLPGPAA
ncbi:methyltransferase [Dactylosporangium roseum]|uniref:Methyltransferase n=1 Tax=Dactylosporangium roseum TaxID=47989 RepID=A0ABY5ZC05_9ACTN|nr:methyltransferase [Dactylosporangium roseum]UWZ38322.1 methyltransferase [Dactylosporangium roseum]